MATNFDSTIVKLSTTQFQVDTSLYDPTFTDDGSGVNIINTRLTVNKEYASTLDISVVGTKTQNITVASPLPSPITDAVYSAELNMYDIVDGLKWTSTSYVLVTTAIDAGIAAYSVINAFTKANKARMVKMRSDIDDFFAVADYDGCNDYIEKIEDALVATQTDFDSTLTLTDRNTLLVVIPEGQTFDPSITQNNLTWNSLTEESTTSQTVVSTFGEGGSGSASFTSETIYDLNYYADGVQWWYIYFWSATDIYGSNSLALITTTIDAQFAIFEANYDPTDATQLAAYNAMRLKFAEIADLSSDLVNNFTPINTRIGQIQVLLALFVVPTIRVTIPSKSNILVEITSTIPNVTYTSQKLALSNCGDDTQEYTLENEFPANYVDVSETLNSETINFGSQYDDSVYQAGVSWNTDNDMSFSGQGYVLVTTQIDCGIAKIIAQHPTCKVLNNKLNEIMTYRRIIDQSFENTDYTTTIFYINLCLNLLTKSGCNCGC